MNEQLKAILYSRYPKLLPTEGQHCLQLFGVECQDGWFTLIYAACELIQRHTDGTESEQVIAVQVKEKFGGLRFYYREGDDYVASLVELVRKLSESICERCGTHGRILESNGWLCSRCPLHKEENGTPWQEISELIRKGDSMADVLMAALALFAFNVRKTTHWLTSPAKELAGRLPLEHLSTSDGHRELLNLIGHIEQGLLG